MSPPPESTTIQPESTNIQTVAEIERQTRKDRTPLERFADGVGRAASSPFFIAAHMTWFTIWILLNTLCGHVFDPYPFNLLALSVGLEATMLASLVLMAQGRMTQQADQRAHLDLQVNLLAEQELTAILRLVARLAENSGLDLESIDPRISQLIRPTDVQQLSSDLQRELDSVASKSGGRAR